MHNESPICWLNFLSIVFLNKCKKHAKRHDCPTFTFSTSRKRKYYNRLKNELPNFDKISSQIYLKTLKKSFWVDVCVCVCLSVRKMCPERFLGNYWMNLDEIWHEYSPKGSPEELFLFFRKSPCEGCNGPLKIFKNFSCLNVLGRKK